MRFDPVEIVSGDRNRRRGVIALSGVLLALATSALVSGVPWLRWVGVATLVVLGVAAMRVIAWLVARVRTIERDLVVLTRRIEALGVDVAVASGAVAQIDEVVRSGEARLVAKTDVDREVFQLLLRQNTQLASSIIDAPRPPPASAE